MSSWMLPHKAAVWLRDHILRDSTIVELGSGEGTIKLSRWFDVETVEHDEHFLDKYDDDRIHYIHCPIAPLKSTYGPADNPRTRDTNYSWYDPDVLRSQLPKDYSAIVVDGPPGNIGRWGFAEHLDMFADVPILFDDIHRSAERELAMLVAQKRNRSLSMHVLTDGRAFGVVGMI